MEKRIIKQLLRELGRWLRIKGSPPKNKDLSLKPQHPYEKPDTVVSMCSHSLRETGGSWGYWPASLERRACSRFRERICLKKSGRE